MPYYFVQNKIVSADKAVIPITDIAFQRGYAVFDFLRTFSGKPFLLDEHLSRLERSAKSLGLRVPYSRRRISEIITNLLKKNKFAEATIKISITGGDLKNSLEFKPGTERFFVMVNELHELSRGLFRDGINLVTVDFLRGLPTAKSIDYTVAVMEQRRSNRLKALEILYKHDGKILESASSNFFIIKGNVLITPKRNILIGITRDFVLKLARKRMKVVERDIKISELREADEAFITATKKDLLPVTKVDNIVIGKGKPGPKTQMLTAEYFKYIHKHYGPSKAR